MDATITNIKTSCSTAAWQGNNGNQSWSCLVPLTFCYRVKQWAYAISQRCLDVDSLVLGKHLPVPIEVKKEEEEIADLMLTAEDTDDSFDSECDDFSSGSDTIKIEEEFALLPSFENSLVGQRYKQETDFETIDESSEKFSNDSNQTEKVEPELQVTSFDLDSFKTFF